MLSKLADTTQCNVPEDSKLNKKLANCTEPSSYLQNINLNGICTGGNFEYKWVGNIVSLNLQ